MAANKRRRLLAAGLGAVIIIIAAVVYFRVILKVEAAGYIEAAGVIEATETELTAKVPGRIEFLCCVEGDSIKAGDVAVRLESGELKARAEEAGAALQGAKDAVTDAEVSLENAIAAAEAVKYESESAVSDVARLRAVTLDARTNLERAQGLYKDGFISKKDMDSAATAFDVDSAQLSSATSRSLGAEANLKSSAANIKAARSRISSASARRKQAEAQLNVALSQLDDTVIRSPIDGVIVYKAFELGEMLGTAAPVYTINDLKNLWARVDIEETQIQKIILGDRAEIYGAAMPGKAFPGKVIEIGRVGEFATQRDVTRGRSDIRTFRIKAGVTSSEGLLKPGMTVNVRIYLNKGR